MQNNFFFFLDNFCMLCTKLDVVVRSLAPDAQMCCFQTQKVSFPIYIITVTLYIYSIIDNNIIKWYMDLYASIMSKDKIITYEAYFHKHKVKEIFIILITFN